MPKAKETIKVEPIHGEPLRYRVESWGQPQFPHVVDLMEYDGNGCCDCKDFTTRCFPNWKLHAKPIEYGHPSEPNPNRTRCRHIDVAVRKFANDTLKEISRMQSAEANDSGGIRRDDASREDRGVLRGTDGTF